MRRSGLSCLLALASTLLVSGVAEAQDPLRVFFMGRSEFGHAGGIPTPFEEICRLAGQSCRGHRHWDFVEPVRENGLPPGLERIANNRHVRRILSDERFDAVFFSLFEYNTEHFSPAPAHERSILSGAESLYRQITAAGARPYLYWGYATRENPSDAERIAEGVALVRAHLDSIAAREGTPAVTVVPVGPFAAEMAGRLGPDRWFDDPLHPSALGQYAIARLIHSVLTGADAGAFGHPPRISEADASAIDEAIAAALARCLRDQRCSRREPSSRSPSFSPAPPPP
jgi:hypothetical protein